MAEPATPPSLAPDATAKFAEFARACKAAARAVALYPGSHPAIGSSLSRLTQATTRLAESGPFKVQVRADSLLLDGALPPRPDPAIAELAEVLYRHMIGALTVNSAADVDSWRTLLLLLARTPEDVRGDGGIGRLWATAGGPSLEIVEIDYAEVLREKQGTAATIDQIIAAAIAGPQMPFDDSTLQALLEIVGDSEKLQQLMAQLETATAACGVDAKTAAFLNLLRGLAEYVARTSPDQLDTIFKQVGQTAGSFSADSMVALLAQRERPEAMAGTINVVGALTDRMSDASVAQFVAGSVISEGGATDRLAHAFQALVPERDRQRQLLALAETEVAASDLGQDTSFSELWGSVEGMLTSYSDESYVSSEYGRELSGARARAVDVERVSDDPPERVAAWLTTVSDSALRTSRSSASARPARDRGGRAPLARHRADRRRPRRRSHPRRLFRPGVATGRSGGRPGGRAAGAPSARPLGAGTVRTRIHDEARGGAPSRRQRRRVRAIQADVPRHRHRGHRARLPKRCRANRTRDRSRRLRDILVGFGAQGRESVQRLMSAPNWEVRRTAAYLLREFGGTEGLKELVPLLTDSEPLVQREAVQGLMMNGSDEAAAILLRALTTATGRTRETLVSELLSAARRAGGALSTAI